MKPKPPSVKNLILSWVSIMAIGLSVLFLSESLGVIKVPRFASERHYTEHNLKGAKDETK